MCKKAVDWIQIYLNRIRTKKSKIQMIKAIQYYVRNKIFSEWVYKNLKGIKEKDAEQFLTRDRIIQIQQDEQQNGIELFRDLSESNELVFGNKNQDVEVNSTFIDHKLSIIRNSIQFNLNLAFTNYTTRTKTYIYELPIMSNIEWNKIMSRVSMVAYFDGMPCGSKTYSNYAVVCSTNNEITVIPDELYYVPSLNFSDSTTEAHRIDCDNLAQLPFTTDPNENNTSYNWDITKAYCISFRSKDLKYDRVYNKSSDKAEYDHLNLMCYDCIVNNNNRFDHLKSTTSSSEKHHGLDCAIDFTYLQEMLSGVSKKGKLLYREYLIAIGCQRQGLYKTNAMTKSEGYSSYFAEKTLDYALNDPNANTSYSFTANRSWNKIKGLEVVVGKVKSSDRNETNIVFEVLQNNDPKKNLGRYTLYTNERTDLKQTIIIDVDPNALNDSSSNINLFFKRLARNTTASLKIYSVRIIYE